MTENEPKGPQRELINSIEGIYVVDAGPGTGKTFTIAHRYAHIIEQGVDPENLLLITFTNSAAQNMKERIINLCDYDPAALRDAPIMTFHGLCNSIIFNHGFDAPQLLGIDEKISSSVRVIENELLEFKEFSRFYEGFVSDHPEYKDFYRVVRRRENLLHLIKTLGAKGIFPTKKGWFRNSGLYLDGDYDEFKKPFREMNESQGENKQSKLREKLSGYKNKCFTLDAPDEFEIRGDKQVPEKYAEECFFEERERLKSFVHDLYFFYIKYALSRNYINFSIMIMFGFVLLCIDHGIREEMRYDHVMIDEFQDTNEIQFKLTLLLSKGGNICAVGDWKQSIFSFQYANVENIIKFEERMKRYVEELNEDHERINYDPVVSDTIHLKHNFRSTDDVIQFSERALLAEATKSEGLDKGKVSSKITRLEAAKNYGDTAIEGYVGDDEKAVILWKIAELIDHGVSWDDIVVLSRTRKFALSLYEYAKNLGFPASYRGGVELFRTRPALLLLAWLRVITGTRPERGWAVILDEAGYTYTDMKRILKENDYPQYIEEFAYHLKDQNRIGHIARSMYDRYGINNPFADAVIDVLQKTYSDTYMMISEMVGFMEDNIDRGETYEVNSFEHDETFTIQTIHSAKGLEYPIVILADPGGRLGGYGSAIEYREPFGLRQKKLYDDKPSPFLYDNWRAYLLSKCLSSDYDEERRILYVALTRAENHIYLTSTLGKESEFFNNLGVEATVVDEKAPELRIGGRKKNKLTVDEPTHRASVVINSHDLIDDEIFSSYSQGRGTEYGGQIHLFAQRLVNGEEVSPQNDDEANVEKLLSSLQGNKQSEVVCSLPLELANRRVLIKGKIDLINVTEDIIELIDFKTDVERMAEEEYRKQLSVYAHVLKQVYQEKTLKAYVYYTFTGEKVEINILSKEELKISVKKQLPLEPVRVLSSQIYYSDNVNIIYGETIWLFKVRTCQKHIENTIQNRFFYYHPIFETGCPIII